MTFQLRPLATSLSPGATSVQGQSKGTCSAKYGVEQVQKWRRGIRHAPPAWTAEMAAATIDRRYAGVPVPESESLDDCAARLQPFLDEILWPAMRDAVARAAPEDQAAVDGEATAEACAQPGTRAAYEAVAEAAAAAIEAGETAGVSDGYTRRARPGIPAFVVASSENVLRALVAQLDDLEEADVPLLDIPCATPLVYRLDGQLLPIKSARAVAPLTCGTYLGDAERIAREQQAIRDQIRTDACDPTRLHGDDFTAVAEEEEEEEPCSALDDDCFEESRDGTLVWKCDEPRSRTPATKETGFNKGVVRPVTKGPKDASSRPSTEPPAPSAPRG